MFQFDFNKIIEEILRDPLFINKVGQFETKNPLLFSSGLFLFLFLGFFGIYLLLRRKDGLRLTWVTFFSLYFYYKCAGIFWLLHVVIVVVDFTLALIMEQTRDRASRLALLVVSLAVNLGMLVYFKFNVYSELWCELTGSTFDLKKVFLPAGISFFTFQSLSYTIEIGRAHV